MVWLHPVTLEQEVSVDVKIARLIAADFDAKLFLDVLSVEISANPVKFIIAQTATLALLTNIVNVLAGSLERTDHCIVAVDACRNTRPDALAVIAILDKALAARKSIVHRLAFGLIENSRVSTLAAGHRSVVLVLLEAISETVADQEGFQVDVSLLVRHDLCREDWNVVTGIRFTSNVEILLRILWELFEEKGKQGVDIFSGRNCVADGVPTV